MFERRLLCAAIAAAMMAAPTAGQSLGDFARQEEARRAGAKKAVKTLSNADLGPGAITPSAGAAQEEPFCYMSISKGTCVSPEELISASVAGVLTKQNAPLEQTYRAEAESLRSQIEKVRQSIATLDGVTASQGRSASDRKGAEAALVAARRTLADLERNWERLERSVGNEHLPHRWIEPAPPLTSVKQ
jgi:hypothetical protein